MTDKEFVISIYPNADILGIHLCRMVVVNGNDYDSDTLGFSTKYEHPTDSAWTDAAWACAAANIRLASHGWTDKKQNPLDIW